MQKSHCDYKDLDIAIELNDFYAKNEHATIKNTTFSHMNDPRFMNDNIFHSSENCWLLVQRVE